MIFARIIDMNGQGATLLYTQYAVALGTDTSIAECYINPSASIAVQQATIADACRQALGAAESEPVRIIGGIVEIG